MENSKEKNSPFRFLARSFFEADPLSAAKALEMRGEEEGAEILKEVPPTLAVKVVSNLDDPFAASLLQQLPREHFDKIINGLDPAKGMSVLLHLSEDARKNFLGTVEVKKKSRIRELLSFPEKSAGRLMGRIPATFYNDLKIREVILKIRKVARRGFPDSQIYVVDREHHLVGIMDMRDILLSEGIATLGERMRREVFSVNCFSSMERAALELSARKLLAAPVVDNDNRLLGVVKADHLLGDVQEAATEDLQKMFGASGEEKAFSPILFSLKTRLPWLHVNLVTAFLAASVVALFEDMIARITALAIFLPVVAGQGGNAGAQSLAVVMRGLVMREIPSSRVKKLLLKESTVGAVNGVVIGLVTGVAAWIWQGNPFLGLVIGLGMVVNLVVAGFSGALIPLAMKKLGLDPAQCSSIILTTVTDVAGFSAFLGFAFIFQGYLA